MTNVKQPFLLISALGLSIVGLLYGFSPGWFAGKFMDLGMAFSFGKGPVDLRHLMRALCGLYIAVSLLWTRSAISGESLDSGVRSVSLICFVVASARLFSIVVDGTPSNFFIASTVAEAVLFLAALMISNK